MAMKINEMPGAAAPGPRGREELAHLDQAALLSRLASHVRQLNTMPADAWGASDVRDLEAVITAALGRAERDAELAHHGNPFEKQQALNGARLRMRMLVQTLQPPTELTEVLRLLWQRLRAPDASDLSSFARRTILNSKTRQDVMNRQIEESVDEADERAAARRVQAVDAEAQRRGSRGEGAESDSESQRDSGSRTGLASATGEPPPTLKLMLRTLKKKRRAIGQQDAEQVAALAFDAMRVLRDEIAPRWSPETQPWMLNTADTHIFQSVLGVIPEALFKETNAYEGMQSLRAGEHAFGLRAADFIADAAARK